jgi:hypothetical protein
MGAGRPPASLDPSTTSFVERGADMLIQPLAPEFTTARSEALLSQAAHARLVREARAAATGRPGRAAIRRLRILRLRPVHA